MIKPRLILIGFEESLSNQIQNQMRHYTESIAFEDTEDALDYFSAQSALITVVLLKLTCETSKNIDFIKTILKNQPLSNIITYSEEPSLEEGRVLFDHGVHNYWIPEDFSMENIKHRLKQILISIEVKDLFMEFLKRQFTRTFDFNRRIILTYDFLKRSCKLNRTVTEDQVLRFLPQLDVNEPCFDALLKFVEKEVSRINTTMKIGRVLVLSKQTDAFKMASLIDQELDITAAHDIDTIENYSKSMTEFELVLIDEDCINEDCFSKILGWFPNANYALLTNSEGSLKSLTVAKELSIDNFLPKQDSASLFCEKIYELLETFFIEDIITIFALQSVETHVDIELRKQVLDVFSKQRRIVSAHIKMGEVYTFLPELRQCHIPEDVLVPESISYPHMDTFVEKLHEALPSFNPGKG